jgi:cell division protein FtsQ
MNRYTAAVPLPLDIRLTKLATSMLGWMLVAMVLAAAGLWAVRHPVWTLRGIEVEGEVQHQNEATFRANVASRLSGSFITLNLADVRAVFEGIPWVRSAVVQRLWPNRLKVTLAEHKAVAWWGDAGGSKLVNAQGEVFEVGTADDDTDRLPELVGPQNQAAQVKAVFDRLSERFAPHDQRIERLELTAQGSWRLELEKGAHIELGRGDVAALEARLVQYLATIEQVTGTLGRKVVSADLRYPTGYALRLQGIATMEPGAPMPKPVKPATVNKPNTVAKAATTSKPASPAPAAKPQH